jgi:rod shape-determining protein MreC
VFFSRRKLIALLVIFCFFCLVFFLVSREAATTLRAFTCDITKIPILIAGSITHEIRALFFFHRSYWDNLKLSKQNEEYRSELLRAQGALAENERLKGFLELKKRSVYAMQTARVIGKDFNGLRPYLLLDKGKAEGVSKYDAVLTSLGLVGKVLELGRYSSKVILVNDPDLSVPALVVRTQEQGLVSGTLDGRCKLRFLDLDSDIVEGDMVVTSGLNRTYPQGIVIGKVKFVGVESSGLGRFALLEIAVKLSSVSEALIAS